MKEKNRNFLDLAKLNFKNNWLKFHLHLFVILFLTLSLFQTTLNAQITIKAVGDIMLGSVTPRKILPPADGKIFAKTIGKYLAGSDITIGNLEGSFITDEMKPKKCSDSSRAAAICYEFGMPENLSSSLKLLGFNMLSMDNNHSQDYGKKGYNFTIKLLRQIGIKPIPKKSFADTLLDNKKIAVAAFGFSGRSYQIKNLDIAKRVIRKLKNKFDLVFVFFHGGAEGKDAAHTFNKDEIYLGRNRGNEIAFAKAVIDAGADLVLGSGPHVLRAINIYKNKLIAFSLGNFLTYGNVNLYGINGISAILQTTINNSNGDFIQGKIIPVRQVGRGIPVYDKSKSAIKIIRKLTQSDFPEAPLLIDSEGRIFRFIEKLPRIMPVKKLDLFNAAELTMKKVKSDKLNGKI